MRTLLISIIGFAIGATAMYIYLTKKYEKLIDEETERIKAVYKKRYERQLKKDNPITEEALTERIEAQEDKTIPITYYKEDEVGECCWPPQETTDEEETEEEDYPPEESEHPEEEDLPPVRIITEEESIMMDEGFYDTCRLTYYDTCGTLTDDEDEWMDAEACQYALGPHAVDFPDYFGMNHQNKDLIFVLNTKERTIYEIARVYGQYAITKEEMAEFE